MDNSIRRGLFPGSFDPVTVGHLDLIRRASQLVDELIVAVGFNPEKNGMFPIEQRMAILQKCCHDLPNVQIDAYSGLTVEYCRKHDIHVMFRGVRNAGDYEAEWNLAQINQRLEPGIETVLLLSRPEHSMISSSVVREAAGLGRKLHGFVPDEVREEIEAYIAGRTAGR
jgi:pantetheine-phosphate adenylyltransferase